MAFKMVIEKPVQHCFPDYIYVMIWWTNKSRRIAAPKSQFSQKGKKFSSLIATCFSGRLRVFQRFPTSRWADENFHLSWLNSRSTTKSQDDVEQVVQAPEGLREKKLMKHVPNMLDKIGNKESIVQEPQFEPTLQRHLKLNLTITYHTYIPYHTNSRMLKYAFKMLRNASNSIRWTKIFNYKSW